MKEIRKPYRGWRRTTGSPQHHPQPAAHARHAIPLAVWLLLHAPALATVITVDGQTGDPPGTSCDLVEAIQNANDDAMTNPDCPAGSAADRIVLTGDVTLTAVDNGLNGLPRISSKIRIDGNGFTIKRDVAASRFRLFEVTPSGDLTLSDATVSDGLLDSGERNDGGAILNIQGNVTLIHTTLSGHSISGSMSAFGAAISSESGTLTLVNSTVSNNSLTAPQAEGGGISVLDTKLTLTNSTISNNLVTANGAEASAAGGGVAVSSGSQTVVLDRVTLSHNTVTASGALASAAGGGIQLVVSESIRMTNSTISGNTAVATGDQSSANGGGAFLDTQASNISFATIAGNSASAPVASGNGIYLSSSPTTFANSIVANGDNCAGFGPITDDGHNFADDASCGGGFLSITPVTDFSVSLADNGGPVETHALPAGSTAIDQDASCGLLIDAREALRDGNCDSGAFEFGVDDRFELSGLPGVNDPDDTCFGHHILFGKTERHLHTVDEDWIWFLAQPGATYEIQTSNLAGDSDTVLELYRSCIEFLIQDDDGGGGFSSKITYEAVAEDEFLDVRIRQFVNSYMDGKGYDISLTCTTGCPSCESPGGEVYELSDEAIVSFRQVEACSTILATGATRIEAGGEAILRAGTSVTFENGFRVLADGKLTVEIDANLQSSEAFARRGSPPYVKRILSPMNVGEPEQLGLGRRQGRAGHHQTDED